MEGDPVAATPVLGTEGVDSCRTSEIAPLQENGDGEHGLFTPDTEKDGLAHQNEEKREKWWQVFLKKVSGNVVPPITMYGGKKKLSCRRSAVVVIMLYLSRSIAAWGDRMWTFAVSLLLVGLYPGSLLMPGILGFLVQLAVAVFGTIVGDYVDANPRRKVASLSLVVQNGLIASCSVVIAIMFYYDLNVCLHTALFLGLVVVVMVLTAGANLANVANKISIEKDWAVVVADNNTDTLAVLNANMRRIDLCCKLVAPAATGVVLQYTNSFYTTIIIASWNVLSFCGELGLVLALYHLVPPLRIKKLRKLDDKTVDSNEKNDSSEIGNDDGVLLLSESDEGETGKDGNENSDDDEEENVTKDHGTKVVVKGRRTSTGKTFAKKLCKMCFTFKEGWKIYIRQEIALVGFSMAAIYLTVLGFSGVTSSYFLTQGLRQDLIGLFQGVGAIFGVIGTVIYPFLRKRVGTVRTGLFGISTQLILLSICVLGVFLPSNTVVTPTGHYYAPVCPDPSAEHPGVAPNWTSVSALLASSIQPTPCTSEQSYDGDYSTSLVPMPTPSPCEEDMADSTSGFPITSTSASNTTTPAPPQGGVNVGLYILITGVVMCRIGLWTFDLAVQQLVQEQVVEEERGVVSGVMNAMNSVNDMLHYGLVIAAPRPENFNILTVISFLMVTVGWILYASYVRKARGHLTHFGDCARKIKAMKRSAS